MQRQIITILVCLLVFLSGAKIEARTARAPAPVSQVVDAQVVEAQDPSVLLAILARNKAHTLPYYLECIENFQYDKQSIVVYINTNNNEDATQEILQAWADKHKNDYRLIVFEEHQVDGLEPTRAHQWSSERLKLLGSIRNKSLQMTKKYGCDYYFVADCDNFLIPETLKDLVSKNKPIVAPLLKSVPLPNDTYANFWPKSEANGYCCNRFPGPSRLYYNIRTRQQIGTFKVDVVHCTYLIKAECLDQLSYVDGSSKHEFVIFSKSACDHGVDQYICNERDYGTQIHFEDDQWLSRQETIEREKVVMASLCGAKDAQSKEISLK